MFFLRFFIVLLLIFSFTITVVPQNREFQSQLKPTEKAWKFADKQLKKMTVEEKVGQLVHVGINARYVNQDSQFFKELKRQVIEDRIGGIILFAAPIYESVHLVNRMQENAKFPLLIGMDAETGVGMRFADSVNFPWNMAVAATGNPEFARKMGEITGREAKALGIQQVYAPVLDVNNNAANPVINTRSYGENPETVARFGNAFIEGLQSQNVLATAKHFPGHGDTNIDSHRGLPIIDVPRERLNNIEFLPFKSAIKAGVGSIMIAHIALPKIDSTEILPLKKAIRPVDAEEGSEIVTEKATIPATLSPVLIQQILQKELGFEGLVATDAMSMSGLTLYVNQDEGAVRAFLAGADLILKPADTDAAVRGLKEAVNSGRIPPNRLDQSVRKILAWKYQLGLFKQKITPLEKIDTIVSNRESEHLAEEISAKAVTLVKSESNLLPLPKNKKVFLLTITNGDDGFMTSAPLRRTLFENGIRFTESTLDPRSNEFEVKRAAKLASEAEIIITALHGRVRSGQSRSIGLPIAGERTLRELLKEDKPIVNISFGNPYLLKDFLEMKNYIVAYGDMPALQKASAKSIFGMQDFYGKLPISLTETYPIGTGISYYSTK
jgi:beta-N-acetylhexosaminidase